MTQTHDPQISNQIDTAGYGNMVTDF